MVILVILGGIPVLCRRREGAVSWFSWAHRTLLTAGGSALHTMSSELGWDPCAEHSSWMLCLLPASPGTGDMAAALPKNHPDHAQTAPVLCSWEGCPCLTTNIHTLFPGCSLTDHSWQKVNEERKIQSVNGQEKTRSFEVCNPARGFS